MNKWNNIRLFNCCVQNIYIMHNYILIFLTIILVKCDSHKAKNDLDQDPLINKYFTKTDKKELEKIISFVDSIVYSKYPNSDMNKSYHEYFEYLKECTYDGGLTGIALDQEFKYFFIFNLDTLLFNKIWRKYTTSQKVRTIDTTLISPENFISIELNHQGDYVKTIEYLGKEYSYFEDIHKIIMECGDIPPTAVGGFIYHHHEFDFNNIYYRLWASIFILTLEESTEKKVDRYLRLSSAHNTH